MQQKEETFPVVISIIKNSMYFNPFTISADVHYIFMQQFWYTIKKAKDIDSYKFLLATNKCIVDADVFRKILDICPRFEGKAFTKEDFTFQIDHGKERKSRRENMPFPRFTKVIIDHFLSKHKSLPNFKYQHYHTIKDNESYEMFLKYSSGQIPPKNSKGKGSQGKKTTDTLVVDVDYKYWRCSHSRHLKCSKAKTNRFKVQSLTPEEQEAADTMQALKESKKTGRRQPGTVGSSKGTYRIPGVPDQSTVISATSSKKQVNDNEDEEMSDAEVKDSGKGNADISYVAKSDVEKTKEVKDDAKKAELRPTSSSISLLDIKIQSEVPHIYSLSVLNVPVSVISKPSLLTHIQETPSAALVTTPPPPSVSIILSVPYQTTSPILTRPITIDALTITTVVPKSDALIVVHLRVAKLEKDVSELKKIDQSTKTLATLKSRVLTIIDDYL
nr:hypothetical protein [Tanacetum cinerariifolium]